MTGGGEGDGRKIDWPLVISIAALLFGVVQFVREMNDNSEEKAVKLEARLVEMKSEKADLTRRVDNLECRAGITCMNGGR